MTYTPKDFARDLLIELSHGYTPLRLAQWADNMLYRKVSETNAEIDRLLHNISCMSFGHIFLQP